MTRLLFFFILLISFRANAYGNIIECQPNLTTKAPVINVGTTQRSHVATVAAKVMCEVYADLGYRMLVHSLPGKRSLKSSNSGKLDGELMRIAKIGEEHLNLIKIKPALFDIEGIAFALNNAISIESEDDLKGKKIGIVRGVKWAKQLTLNARTFVVGDVFSLMKLLKSGRVDLVLSSKRTGSNALNKHFPNLQVTLSPALITMPVFHFINKKHQKLKTKLTKSLIALEKSGSKSKLINIE